MLCLGLLKRRHGVRGALITAWEPASNQLILASTQRLIWFAQLMFLQRTKSQSLQKDRQGLISFYDCPAQYWQSTYGQVIELNRHSECIRHHTKRSKGCLTQDVMFQLGHCAQHNRRRQREFEYMAQVVAGVAFKHEVNVAESYQASA